MTAVIPNKSALTVSPSPVARARAGRERALREEFSNLLRIAWDFHDSASQLLLAVMQDKEIDNDTRRDLIQDVFLSLDETTRYVRQALGVLDRADVPF